MPLCLVMLKASSELQLELLLEESELVPFLLTSGEQLCGELAGLLVDDCFGREYNVNSPEDVQRLVPEQASTASFSLVFLSGG